MTIVYFNINPCGVHPWHVHEDMDEYCFVLKGSGRVLVSDPLDQSVQIISVEPGDLITLPQGHMHTFEASGDPDGLQFVAFGDVQDAHLALVPLFLAMQPPPFQEYADPNPDKKRSRYFSDSYAWADNMARGGAGRGLPLFQHHRGQNGRRVSAQTDHARKQE